MPAPTSPLSSRKPEAGREDYEARLNAVGVRFHGQTPEDLQGLVQVRDTCLGVVSVPVALMTV